MKRRKTYNKYDKSREVYQTVAVGKLCTRCHLRRCNYSEGKIVFYSDLYIEIFKAIGLTVRRMDLTYDLANTAFLEN